MESCRLSIELCEAIMDALPDVPVPFLPWSTRPTGQRTLCACALTCRAWRVRAQYLLLAFPHLLDGPHLSLFIAAVRTSPKPPTATLDLRGSNVDLKLAAQLFIQPFPHLQHWSCACLSFDSGLPLRLFRMRLPFFANINALEMWYCSFESARAMLDVVWACPNLSSLDIDCVSLQPIRSSTAGYVSVELSATCKHLRACRKLTKLILDHSTLTTIYMYTHASFGFSGSVFGHAVTDLQLQMNSYGAQKIISFLADSFPALRSIYMWSTDPRTFARDIGSEPPWLHAIAAGRAVPGTPKIITIEYLHDCREDECCKVVVGTGEEVAGSQQRLPELLSGLERLTFCIQGREDLLRCAAYISSVLPSMRNVLRFQYRASFGYDWESYTVPDT